MRQLAYLCDVKMREAAAGRGEDLNTLPRVSLHSLRTHPLKLTPRPGQYASLINAAIRDFPGRRGLHLCRGNFKSRHFAEGGYEPIAEVLFRELDVDTYFLECPCPLSSQTLPTRF